MLKNDKHLNKGIYILYKGPSEREMRQDRSSDASFTPSDGVQVSPDQIIISSDVHLVPDWYASKTAEELLIDPPLWSKALGRVGQNMFLVSGRNLVSSTKQLYSALEFRVATLLHCVACLDCLSSLLPS